MSLVSATTWLITGTFLSSFGATAGHGAALMSSRSGSINHHFASQNALHVTPRANAAIDSRFMDGNRQVTPKPTLPAKLGRSECMVRPLARLSPRGVAHDRGNHATSDGKATGLRVLMSMSA